MSNIGGFDLDGDDKIRLQIAEVQAERDQVLDAAGVIQDLIVADPAAAEAVQKQLEQFDILEADLKTMLTDPEES